MYKNHGKNNYVASSRPHLGKISKYGKYMTIYVHIQQTHENAFIFLEDTRKYMKIHVNKSPTLIYMCFGSLDLYFGCWDLHFKRLDLYFDFWTCILCAWTCILGVRADGRAGGWTGGRTGGQADSYFMYISYIYIYAYTITYVHIPTYLASRPLNKQWLNASVNL